MSTQPKTIDDISRTKTVIDGTERVPGRDSSGDFKITITNLISSLQSLYIGQEMKFLNCYKPISASFPWYCMSLPDATLTTANFDAAFITEMRSRKVVYDELNTAVSSFSGSWSSNVFTLTDNTANNAMLEELAEDYLFAGSPTTNWRILHDGTNEFNITAISVSARTITVNLDSKTASGTSITIYTNRVYGSTTSCRHFSEAGLASYQAGGGKIKGLRRRDKLQGFKLRTPAGSNQSGAADFNAEFGGGANTLTTLGGFASSSTYYPVYTGNFVNDGTHGDPRTGSETQAKSGTDYKYIFVGSYTE